MRQALSVVSECAPLIKTGGLADVAGALPAALAHEGWHLRSILPGYPSVMRPLKSGTATSTVVELETLFGGPARLLSCNLAGLDMLILDAPHLYDREGSIYLGLDGNDWPDNPVRFAALSRVAAWLATSGPEEYRPEILHLHDWQAGLTPIYLKQMAKGPVPGTLFTIHNIAFHGLADQSMLSKLQLPRQSFTPVGFEFYGKISALKAGLMFSDKLTTVSPQYALELMEPEFGMGLDGVLRHRRNDLVGILNGIDLDGWNPSDDEHIVSYTTARGKARNKARLRKEFDLPQTDGPLAVVVTRLTTQKGLDLLLEALPGLIDNGGQLALLGSGDHDLELGFMRLAANSPNVGVRIGYDESLSHRLIAGGDAILVPSRFEPCGLTQLYGLRYGTIPVVARTGGLSDTVVHANEVALRSGVATGIQVAPNSSSALYEGLKTLCTLYSESGTWAKIQKNAMKQAVGWGPSASHYAALYNGLSKQA